ncbi:MAG: UDP-glucose 4-epimerase GalE [Azospirillaceae bacterium]
MAKILVPGGAGYIGAHTCKALAAAGHVPVVVDDLSSGRRDFVQWGPLHVSDMADRSALARIVREEAIEAVVHFAASIEVGLSVKDPASFYANNVVNTLGLLDVMREAGVAAIVFSSTAATYGMPQTSPIPEDHPTVPINPYGETKLAVERALKWYGEAYGLRWTALRYFNAAGADPDGAIGEAHEPETHLIPLVIEAMLGRRGAVKVFGTDYDTPDGTAIRDYVHVADLADAHVRAVERLLGGAEPLVCNLGTGTGYSVRQILDGVARISGRPVPQETAPRRTGDPARLVADPSRAKAELGWRLAASDLDTVIATALAWHEAGLSEPAAARTS